MRLVEIQRRMKIYKARAPMRIGFFGGGTDVSPYAEEHGGKVLNCTINLFVRCQVCPADTPGMTIRSLDLEQVSRAVSGQPWDGHLELPQAVLDAVHRDGDMAAAHWRSLEGMSGVDVTMFSDAPPGSGLGSSSALVVSMLKLLYATYGVHADPHTLAEQAYRIEREDLAIPGGRQDQYSAAFGGMRVYHFGGPRVIVESVLSDDTALLELESSLLIGYMGNRQMFAQHLMHDQVRRLTAGDTLRYHDITRQLVDEAVQLLQSLKIDEFGRLLHEAWHVKKAFSPHISTPYVDEVYALAREHGAWGGKISGAGGGGFMVFAVPFERRLELERVLTDAGVHLRPFSFVNRGVEVWAVGS